MINKVFSIFLSAFLLLTFSSLSAVKENSNKMKFKKSPLSDTIKIGEVEVTGLRMNRQMQMVPAPMSVIGNFDFNKGSALSMSHILQREPGIGMSSDGVWSTGLNIRGLDESRLVVLIDGNRVETATDLTASMSMVDVNEIKRVEIIRGAQSSLYGTGAMGGIINIITKEGHFSPETDISGSVSTGYASANMRLNGYGSINAGAEKWFFRAGAGYTSADDIRTPQGILDNSGYTTNNISAKAGLKPWANHLLTAQFQLNRNNNVGIPGGDAFPGPAEATYREINRSLFNFSYSINNISKKLSSVEMNIFRQFIIRNVELKPNTVTEALMPNGNIQRTTPELFTPGGEHLTIGGRIQTNWEFSPKNSFIAGIDMWGRELITSREKFIRMDILNPSGEIIKTNNLERGETPIPKSQFNSGGLFFQNEAKWYEDQLIFVMGGRIDMIQISNKIGYDVDYLIVNDERNDTPPAQRVTFESEKVHNFSWSVNSGLLWKVRKDLDAVINLARSFRAPSLEERYKYIDLGSHVLLGDPALKPELGYSADIGVRIWRSRFTLQSELFVNTLTNMIVEVPGEFIFRLVETSLPDTLPALIYDNVNRALLYGFNISAAYNPIKNIVLFGSTGYVRGKNRTSDKDLPQIPPLKGVTGIRYTLPKIGSAELSVTVVSKQSKIADGELTTDGYYRLDLGVYSRRINIAGVKMQLFTGVDNLTDNSYTNHLSTNRGSISIEPGRNIFSRLILDF